MRHFTLLLPLMVLSAAAETSTAMVHDDTWEKMPEKMPGIMYNIGSAKH
jgi:hypothetical protein